MIAGVTVTQYERLEINRIYKDVGKVAGVELNIKKAALLYMRTQ